MPTFVKNMLTNWKTTAAGVVVLALYGLQSVGVVVPGVHENSGSLAVAMGLIFASDSK